MVQKTYNVVVLLITENNVDTIDRSIQSIFTQNYDLDRIKIVVVDNFSTDGTYEKLMDYIISNDISVYRLDKKYIKTRIMYHANLMLQFTLHKYITILNPGDILRPDYIEKCCSLMDNSPSINSRVLICETDILDENKNVIVQNALYNESKLLERSKDFITLFINGLGHKVQCFYQHGTISNSLVELPHFVDFTDLFKNAFLLINTDFLYEKEVLATTCKIKYDDPLEDLLFRYYFIIRLVIYRGTINNESTAYLEPLITENEIYEKLSLFALQYALEAIDESKFEVAEKILLFAEMLDENIIKNSSFIELSTVIKNNFQ